MSNEEKYSLRALVDEYLDNNDDLTLRKLGDELSLPERGIRYSGGAVGNWRYMTSNIDVISMRDIARHGKTERAREFARRVLAIYGLKLLDE
jgi:hypothetical protein